MGKKVSCNLSLTLCRLSLVRVNVLKTSSTSDKYCLDSMSIRPSVRVCIIGAGLAGLSAAEALALWGKENKEVDLKVTVIEAMNRPGGRALTVSFGDGIVEEGAQYIHGCEGNPVYHRARLNQLKLNRCDRPDCTFHINQRNGKHVSQSLYSEVGEVYDTILLKTQAGVNREERKGCGDKSVGAFMKRYFEKYFIRSSGSPMEKEIKMNIIRTHVISECCYSACNHLNDLMLQDFGEYNEILGNVTFADGYNQFVETFLKNIPSESLLYSKPVKQVVWTHGEENAQSKGNTIAVICQDGDEIEADYVIVTTSLGYLKEHATTMFSPSLPSTKLDLISRMGFGTAGKIFLEYGTRFWAENWGGIYLVWDAKPEDFMLDEYKEEEWYKHFYSIQSIQDNPKLLKVWMFGRSAEYIETLDDRVIANTLTDVLRQFLNNPKIPVPDRVLKTQWHSNPYVRGSYSYVATGSCGADIDALAEPVCVPGQNGMDRPAICFAGEATHRTFYSTTHGAMLSGQREAERILKDVQLRATLKPMMWKEDERTRETSSEDMVRRIGSLAL